MTRAAYGARQTSTLAAQPPRLAPVSGPSFFSSTRSEPPLIHTLPVRPTGKFLVETNTAIPLSHLANIPEIPADGAENKTTPELIPTSKSSLRATPAEFTSMRVFIQATQRENQSEPLPTPSISRKPDLQTMQFMDLPIAEETDNISVLGDVNIKNHTSDTHYD
ncbi:hypothetical protein N7513_012335 [Penicillium frequentans]|nr:hypothetical protein N7513_012335 [Penicillium glabrum]